MIGKKSVVLLFAVFLYNEAAFIDTLGKCSIKDSECLARLFSKSMASVAKTGIPEYEIPPFDPYEIKNISVSVLNLVDISMVDGVAKNIKTCVFDSINLSLEDLHSSMEITCDVTVKGHYNVATANPIVKNFLGSTVKGDGFGKVKLDKLHLSFETDFFLRKVDGDVFCDWKYENMRYNYTIGKAAFSANNIYIGEAELSNQIVGMINENWEFIMTTFGKPFIDVAIKITNMYMHKFFDVVPTKHYFIEDVSQYVRK